MGEQQIGAQIEHNQIDLGYFLKGSADIQKVHEPDANNVAQAL